MLEIYLIAEDVRARLSEKTFFKKANFNGEPELLPSLLIIESIKRRKEVDREAKVAETLKEAVESFSGCLSPSFSLK